LDPRLPPSFPTRRSSDLSGARLVIQSKETGQASGFRITASDADGNDTDGTGLSALAYDPQNGTTGTQQTQAAANAKATINGVEVDRKSTRLNSSHVKISY